MLLSSPTSIHGPPEKAKEAVNKQICENDAATIFRQPPIPPGQVSPFSLLSKNGDLVSIKQQQRVLFLDLQLYGSVVMRRGRHPTNSFEADSNGEVAVCVTQPTFSVHPINLRWLLLLRRLEKGDRGTLCLSLSSFPLSPLFALEVMKGISSPPFPALAHSLIAARLSIKGFGFGRRRGRNGGFFNWQICAALCRTTILSTHFLEVPGFLSTISISVLSSPL